MATSAKELEIANETSPEGKINNQTFYRTPKREYPQLSTLQNHSETPKYLQE
jgi:hypothetical protein